MRHLVWVLALVALTTWAPAFAQSFNLDVGGGAHALPDATYGGAAESPGQWQALDLGAGQAVTLLGLDGAASAVTLTPSAALTATRATPVGATGDDAALLGDFVDLGAAPTRLTIAGLSPGRYLVYTYGWSPDDTSYVTYVSIGDDTWALAGAWPGHLEAFVTHALHEVEVVDADEPVIVTVVGVDRGALNGMQIVRLPDDPPPIGEPRGFNLDAGAELGEPSRGYGGAAGQVGVWMQLHFNIGNPVTLNGLDGQPTTITVEANLPFGPAFFAHPGPSGDDERLLEDYLDLHSTSGTFAFKGVPAGEYDIYSYAWGPDDDRYRTHVTILEQTQVIGGAWPGALTEGVTHARHRVTVPPSGKLTIQTFGTKGTLNGIQIVPVSDEPAEPSPEASPEATVESPEADTDTPVEVVADPAPDPEEVEPEDVEPVAESAPEPAPEVVEAASDTGAASDLAGRGGGGCAGGDGSGLLGLLAAALSLVARLRSSPLRR